MDREPILNVPSVITALIGILVAVHLAVEAFPRSLGQFALEYFAFVPARAMFLIAPSAVLRALGELDADDLAVFTDTARYAWATPLTYAFLHANWTHLCVNALSLAAFGSPVAQRLGTVRFLVFFGVTAIAGAAAHFLSHPFDLEPVVGASAAISGTMAGIARFAFAPGAALDGGGARRAPGAGDGPAQTLATVFANRRAAIFLATWLLVNLLFGLFAPATDAAGPIAWEAHIGGFLAGLLIYGWFDGVGGRKPSAKRGMS